MGNANQVENAPEDEVVVDEAVPSFVPTHYGFEWYLQFGKQLLDPIHYVVADPIPPATNSRESAPDGQKFLLHQSVSRYKPLDKLEGWINKLHNAPTLLLHNSKCVISLIQPGTKRPGRVFYNPSLPNTKYPCNDGISYSAIVLLYHGVHPVNEHDEASHLCGHPRCVNIDHLIWESIGNNSARNECHHYAVECTHNPPCIAMNKSDRLLVKNVLAKHTKKNKKLKLTKYFLTNSGLPPNSTLRLSQSHSKKRTSSLSSGLGPTGDIPSQCQSLK